MQIRITKTQESTKTFRKGKNVKLTVEIGISLSEEEMELINKYHDPLIDEYSLKAFAGGDAFSPIKIVEPHTVTHAATLSEFKLVAWTEDGFGALGNMQTLVKAVIGVAKDKIGYLATLEKWEGTEIVSID